MSHDPLFDRGPLTASCIVTRSQSLLDNVERNFTRAERDNDLIYHQEVPALTSLPPIVEVSMVQATVPGGLTDPKAALGSDAIVFSELVGHGARMAIGMFAMRDS